MNKKIISDIRHLCTFYQGREVSRCVNVMEFLNNLEKQGNPVPSLELDKYDDYLQWVGYPWDDLEARKEEVDNLKTYLEKYGVETDNEQPICTGLSEPRCKCINFCTITGSDEDM